MIAHHIKLTLLHLLAVVIAVGGVIIAPSLADAQSSYGSGSYGTCTYNSCGITVGASPSVALDVTPTASGTSCSVASNQVQVTTDSSTGYTLSMTDSDTDTSLQNGSSGTIMSTSGTSASPSALSANKWGYRVDGVNGFGAGPTSAVSSSTIPTLNFAGIPSSSATPDTIATATTAADPAVSTNVWYGLCVNAATPNGAYADSVTYTAVVN